MIRVDCDSPCALPCLQESSSLQESICHVFAIYFFQFLHFSVCPWLTCTCLVQLSIFQMVPLQLEGDRHGATLSAQDQAVGSCCAHCRFTVDNYLAYMCVYMYTFIFMMLYDCIGVYAYRSSKDCVLHKWEAISVVGLSDQLTLLPQDGQMDIRFVSNSALPTPKHHEALGQSRRQGSKDLDSWHILTRGSLGFPVSDRATLTFFVRWRWGRARALPGTDLSHLLGGMDCCQPNGSKFDIMYWSNPKKGSHQEFDVYRWQE